MSSYISVVFEKDYLSTSKKVRVIVRNRDDGGVPPNPSGIYFPTQGDDLRDFIVGQFINNTSGEQYIRIATLADLSDVNYLVLPLTTFEDLAVNFSTVVMGDLLQITVPDSQLWTSDEYTDTNPHIFPIASVVSTTKITVTKPFPAFLRGATWSIPARGLSGIAGVTLRAGTPSAGPFYFRDRRLNRLYTTTGAVSAALDAENSVIAMKAYIKTLLDEVVGATLITEVVTVSSSI